MDVVNAYTNFNGRMRRRHFWIFSILLWMASVAFMTVFGGSPNDGMGFIRPYRFDGAGIFGFVAGIAVFAATLAVHVKRWHDRDKSWPWALLLFVPVIGWVWILIECGFLDGTTGPNRFGPSPKSM